MTSPDALLFSIVGAGFGFIIALVGIIAAATIAPSPADRDTVAHSIVASVAQDALQVDRAAYTVVLEPAASGRQARGR